MKPNHSPRKPRQMHRGRAEILAAYDAHNDDTISTERLLELVCNDCGCDVDTVLAALLADNRLSEVST